MKTITIDMKKLSAARIGIVFIVIFHVVSGILLKDVAQRATWLLNESERWYFKGIGAIDTVLSIFAILSLVYLLLGPYMELVRVGTNDSDYFKGAFKNPEQFMEEVQSQSDKVKTIQECLKLFFAWTAFSQISHYAPYLEALFLFWGFAVSMFGGSLLHLLLYFVAAFISAFYRKYIGSVLEPASVVGYTQNIEEKKEE